MSISRLSRRCLRRPRVPTRSQSARWPTERAVPPLAEAQLHLRRAVVAGDATDIAPHLVGGRDPQKRLAIHRRNYETSLVNALLGKFPATHWAAGHQSLSGDRA